MTDWLQPLWEERAPRYTRALLETLALVAYRQPITRAEIEEVRGVVVSTNIIRTLLERSWIRVVGHRDVPGKPAMFGTTKDFLDYFGLKKLDELPTLAELKDGFPEASPQSDLLETLTAGAPDATRAEHGAEPPDRIATVTAFATVLEAALEADVSAEVEEDADDESELSGADLVAGEELEEEVETAGTEGDEADLQSAEVIPLRAADDQ
jgi:segregation and condensation protein B